MAIVPFGAPEEWPICGAPECGLGVDYSDCFDCGGEGGRDLYEEDPLAYGPDDWAECPTCDGTGTLIWCPTHGRIERTTFRPLVVVSSEKL